MLVGTSKSIFFFILEKFYPKSFIFFSLSSLQIKKIKINISSYWQGPKCHSQNAERGRDDLALEGSRRSISIANGGHCDHGPVKSVGVCEKMIITLSHTIFLLKDEYKIRAEQQNNSTNVHTRDQLEPMLVNHFEQKLPGLRVAINE